MKIRFYQTLAGSRPVEKYLQALPLGERAKIAATIEDICQHGLEGSSATFRHIQGRLWEIKVSSQRVFYVIISGPEMILLHAYKKQTQKAPKKEIETAQHRMKDVLGD